MGDGEVYLESFWSYYNSLDEEQQNEYRKNNQPPLKWSGFYQRGTTKYVIANLLMMAFLFTALVFSVSALLSPPWWCYLLILPISFFIAGYAEERLLSGVVNRLVSLLFAPNN